MPRAGMGSGHASGWDGIRPCLGLGWDPVMPRAGMGSGHASGWDGITPSPSSQRLSRGRSPSIALGIAGSAPASSTTAIICGGWRWSYSSVHHSSDSPYVHLKSAWTPSAPDRRISRTRAQSAALPSRTGGSREGAARTLPILSASYPTPLTRRPTTRSALHHAHHPFLAPALARPSPLLSRFLVPRLAPQHRVIGRARLILSADDSKQLGDESLQTRGCAVGQARVDPRCRMG